MADEKRRQALIDRIDQMPPGMPSDKTKEQWKERLTAGRCPMCGDEIVMDDFKDSASVAEFRLSHMCVKCQEEIFTED